MNEEQMKIHIAVACHKPSRLPRNSCLVPVQVNSARAKTRMDMEHDDEGDNISTKNAEYCELTAQYWEWKNVEADYYGLCHYRRFLCFTVPEDAVYNERLQIEAEAIDDHNLARFGLEDEAQMREVIAAYDVVTGEQQVIERLYTPRGNQVTAYKHWTAHNRALVMTEDLEKMLSILEDVAPEIGRDTREYLQGKVFSGFNCFVMKKALFQELCEIEFAVLERLEKCVDLTHYCTQLSRVYGFMGEIISSGYIYHLEKQNRKIKHVPLLYFNCTDEADKAGAAPGEIPVLFYQAALAPEFFAVTWRSFLDNRNPETKYNAIICHHGMSSAVQKILVAMAKDADNVSVRFLDGLSLKKSLAERYNVKSLGPPVPLLPFLPYFLEQYSEMLFLSDQILVESPLDELWNVKIANGRILAAPQEAYMLSQINEIYPETKYNYIKAQMKDPYSYYSVAAMKIDLTAYREKLSPEQMLGYCRNTQHRIRNDDEILNVAFENSFQKIDQKWCVYYNSSPALEYFLPYAPRETYQELMRARLAPGVVTFLPDDPFSGLFTELTPLYWNAARKTPVYELCLAHTTEVMTAGAHRPRELTKKLFKKGTKCHAVVSRLIPKGSSVYRWIKKALSVFHLE